MTLEGTDRPTDAERLLAARWSKDAHHRGMKEIPSHHYPSGARVVLESRLAKDIDKRGTTRAQNVDTREARSTSDTDEPQVSKVRSAVSVLL